MFVLNDYTHQLQYDKYDIEKKYATWSKKIIRELVTDNYQSFFVDFTNEQNQSNQGLCVKFNVSDSRNAYNTNAFFQFKDVYGDENCAFLRYVNV